jgi:ABC-2 type transport system permease protein
LVGFPPNAEELWRMLIFTILGIFYVGFWLALALLFSLLFQRTVTAALGSLALWLFLTIFAPLIAQIAATFIIADPLTPEDMVRQVDIANMISRISPSTLYGETVQVMLNPLARGLGTALPEQTQGILLTPLALSQSLLLVLPQLTTLIALVAVCFAISYIKFMRTEIRA